MLCDSGVFSETSLRIEGICEVSDSGVVTLFEMVVANAGGDLISSRREEAESLGEDEAMIALTIATPSRGLEG